MDEGEGFGNNHLELGTTLGGFSHSFFRLLGDSGQLLIHILKGGFNNFSFGFRDPSFKTGGTFNRKTGLYSIKNANRSRLFWSIRSK